jgi:hypothetical protein
MRVGSRRCAVVLFALACWASAPALPAPARAVSPRELEAREAFVTGEYRRALTLFGKLYAETLHPTYLRNIGRCYQNLAEPERAITAFRDYLRKAAPLPAAERAEIEGYIAEMEALARQRSEARISAPSRTTPPPALVAAPSAPAAGHDQEKHAGRKWWLWAGLGVVAVGVAGLAAALALSGRTDAACPGGTTCYRP